MSRLYSSTNRIKFTDVPEKYAVPRPFKAKLSDVHSAVVIYVATGHFTNTRKYRQKVTDALNVLTYCIIQNSPPPFTWSTTDPINTMPADIDLDDVEKELGDLFLTEEAIEWDVTPVDSFISDEQAVEPNKLPSEKSKEISPDIEPEKPVPEIKAVTSQSQVINKPLKQLKELKKQGPSKSVVTAGSGSSDQTPKEDLYIQPPKCPRFDVSKVWLSQQSGADQLVIYTTLPEIPTKQNEISITTKLEQMTEKELMNLYPKQLIRTRSAKMYDKIDGLDYDEDLGVLIPVEGFTKEQLIDNIIQYPHLYKLRKIDLSGKASNFYTSIEIDGELLPVESAWDTIPESKLLPRDPEFVKEYVVRRYLLEESVGKEHRFKMAGTLDPFLTLFMPPAGYMKRGYNDVLSIVKQCVRSRVRYKQSRNPILRRLGVNV